MSYVLGPSVLSAGHFEVSVAASTAGTSATVTDNMAKEGRTIIFTLEINDSGLTWVEAKGPLYIKTITDDASFIVAGFELGNATGGALSYYINYLIMEATT